MPIKQFLLSPQCLQCSSFSVEEHLFCKICYEKIIEVKLLRSEFKNENHIYLLRWGRADPESFSQLIYRLKNVQSEKALQFYCNLLHHALSELNIAKQNNLLVPVPGSQHDFSHANSIAKRLEQRGWGTYFSPLAKRPSEQQKHLSRTQRSENQFYLKTEYEHFTQNVTYSPHRPQRLLFIDDVLTTGLSFKRCSELLNAPADSLCITLFYRENAGRT